MNSIFCAEHMTISNGTQFHLGFRQALFNRSSFLLLHNFFEKSRSFESNRHRGFTTKRHIDNLARTGAELKISETLKFAFILLHWIRRGHWHRLEEVNESIKDIRHGLKSSKCVCTSQMPFSPPWQPTVH